MKKDTVFFSQLNFVSFNFQDVGIPFKINGVVRHFNGTIGQCLADNLGSHYLGGFMEGFNSYRRCRFCMGSPEEIQQKVMTISIKKINKYALVAFYVVECHPNFVLVSCACVGFFP